MFRTTHTAASLALAVTVALAAAAWADENAGAVFSLTAADELLVGPDETVMVQISASGLTDVRSIEISLDVSPVGAFDLAATAFEVPTSWILPGSSVTGDSEGRFGVRLTTASDFSVGTEATIAVGRISIESSSQGRDEFDGGELGLSIGVNTPVTAVLENALPAAATALAQNYPNPFNAGTTIRFELSGDASVTLTVYNIVGQVVRKLIADEFLEAGSYRQSWDGLNSQGDIVGSGLYFYEMRAGSYTSIRKMTLLQ